MKKLIALLFLTLILSSNANATEMVGEKYKIEEDAGRKGNSNFSEQFKTYNNISEDNNFQNNIIKGKNYTVYFPYENVFNKVPIGISLSNDRLDFGTIESGEPIIRNHELNIFSPSKIGYIVYIFQDKPLTSISGVQIPNTTCDSGNCTSVLSDTWKLPLTYGFGYTCENKNSCSSVFHKDYYRRLASELNDESPVKIIESSGNSRTNILFKINIPSTQLKESYSNTLFYILISKY